MSAYFIRRFLLIIPTFIGITLLVFAVTRVVPGGPIERMMTSALISGEQAGARRDTQSGNTLSEEQIKQLEAYYGFDKPLLESYSQWLGRVLQFDLGESSRYHDPVWEIIKERFPVSIFYGLTTLLITYIVCIPLGVNKALHHSSILDNASSAVIFLGYALPSYVVGIALVSLFSAHWDISVSYTHLTLPTNREV